MVDRLGFTVQRGAVVSAGAAGRAGAIGVGAQVETRTKAFTTARDQDDVHIGVQVGPFHQSREFQWGVGDDRVALVGAIEGNPRNPVGDLIGHRLQVVEVDRSDRVCHPLIIARSRIGARSSPVGMVPKAPPHCRSSLVAKKASATAGCPCRTSSEPWSARQMSSATLRARY